MRYLLGIGLSLLLTLPGKTGGFLFSVKLVFFADCCVGQVGFSPGALRIASQRGGLGRSASAKGGGRTRGLDCVFFSVKLSYYLSETT